MNGGEEGDTLPSSKSIKRNATTTKNQPTENSKRTTNYRKRHRTNRGAHRKTVEQCNHHVCFYFPPLPKQHHLDTVVAGLLHEGFCWLPPFASEPEIAKTHLTHTLHRQSAKARHTHTSAPHFDRPTARPDPTCKARIQMHRHTRAPALPTPRDTNYAFN